MKYSLLISAFILTACGNPHISSTGSGLERTNPPLNPVEMECADSATGASEITFFSGTHANNIPQVYLELSKCKKTITETFQSFSEGLVSQLDNQDRETHSYELIHSAEKNLIPEKAMDLSDYFGAQTFDMNVMNLISQDAVSGTDHGVDSTRADKASKDALIWSFSHPVSIWSAKGVDLEAGSVLRIFDCDQYLLKEVKIAYPNQSGDNELHVLGINSNQKNICYISLTATKGESLAIDEFSYGD